MKAELESPPLHCNSTQPAICPECGTAASIKHDWMRVKYECGTWVCRGVDGKEIVIGTKLCSVLSENRQLRAEIKELKHHLSPAI